MDFDLQALLAAHRSDGYELYGRYLNPQHPKVLHAIGFDKVYERAEGAYLYDTDGNQYADFLSGFGVFAAGRNHPVIRRALHDALDAQLADWTQFDCGPLPGLLAQRPASTPADTPAHAGPAPRRAGQAPRDRQPRAPRPARGSPPPGRPSSRRGAAPRWGGRGGPVTGKLGQVPAYERKSAKRKRC